jgi:trans-aconitate methyltransferase
MTLLMSTDAQPHSAEYLGEQRDFWWNPDFLRLMARRWRLSDVRAVLDVGCGLGHWGRLLASLLPARAAILGIDREPAWIR